MPPAVAPAARARLAAVAPAALAEMPAVATVAASVPITLQPPTGNVAYLLGHATGVQIYTCTVSGASFSWGSSIPAATLYNAEGDQIATHFAGPTWQANDGSTVVGHKLQSVTVTPDSIPWLLLSATSTTTGTTGGDTLSETTYIQRLFTRGGLAPAASSCNVGTVSSVASIPYTAIYVFFEAVAFVASASYAAVGQTITVTGSDFAAGEPVQVYGDMTGTTPLATGNADGSGTFVASFSVPAGLYAVHTILAGGQSSGATDFAYIQEEPRLTLAPQPGAAGSQVVAGGAGFGAAETVTLTLDSPTGLSLGSTTSDALGNFSGATAITATLPLTTTAGVHLLYATGQSSGARAVAGFLVH